MKHQQITLAIFGAILILFIGCQNSVGDSDPFISNAVYSKEGYEEVILVEDGRDNATFFKYLIIDDYSEAPENWTKTEFNDSAWIFGAAPFGDRPYNNVDPNTDWDTSGSSPHNDDVILIRHSFDLSNEIIISAEFDAAFTNYCTPYLNGNQLYSERGGNSHGMEYWNDDGNEEVPIYMFNEGKNVLAVYGRDYVYGSGNQNRQWLDVQLKASLFRGQNDSIIFGDEVTILIQGGNQGNASASDVEINATSNGSEIENITFANMESESYGNTWIKWAPENIGLNQLYILISCECNETNTTNNLFILNITAQIYSLNASFTDETLIINQTRKINYTIKISNTGNLTDNVTLTQNDSNLNDWNIEFTPNNFLIEPKNEIDVTISAEIPSNYNDGNYSIPFSVESQYNYVLAKTLVSSGKDNLVDWKWINSTDDEELYNNTNWTELNFNDNNWSYANTPFGDSAVEGVDYRTLWEGDNYGYFRHILNIPDIELYENGYMRLNIATNNYGNHYINGYFVFGDIDGGGGHGAEYWNEEVEIYTNYLKQGDNIIASLVYNPQNTQWFDQEIIITFPQSNLWKYKNKEYNLPIYLDSTAPSTKVREEGFYRNSSTFEINWIDLSDSEDLEGYYIYYLEKVGSTLGDWTNLGFYTNNSLNFTGENGKIYRFKSVAKDFLGNLEYKSTYDTEMMIDLFLPKTSLWLSEGDIKFTKLNGVTVNWKANNTNDIQKYIIQYQHENNDTWVTINEYDKIDSFWFAPYTDGEFKLRSLSIDYAGNMEVKNQSDITITFDRLKPEIKINKTSELTGKEGLILEISYKSENLSNIELQYARLLEGSENRLEWIVIESEWNEDKLILNNLVDGYTYYFRTTPTDLANNSNSRNPYIFNVIWKNQSSIELPNLPLKPVLSLNPLSNMKITVDEDLDGNYEKSLQEYVGTDLSFMKANQYWIDYLNGRVIFGNEDYGYSPPVNASINLDYEAYDARTTIDTTGPGFVRKPNYSVENNNVTITWKAAEDATKYIIEYRKDLASSQWESIDTINGTGKEELNYKIANLSSGYHYYRIISVDRMNYNNNNMEGDLLEVFIEAEINTITTDEKNENENLSIYILSAFALITLAGGGGYYLINKNEIESNNAIPVLLPLEEIDDNSTEYEINGIQEGENPFRVLEGSEFSRDLMFICKMGCQSEFKGTKDDDEVMCPHCGMMGESPL